MMLILLPLLFFGLSDVSSQGTPYQFDQNEINLILQEHNRYRASEPAAYMQELVWNDQLVAVARDWATRCIGDHRPDRTYKAGFLAIGENLWWTSSRVLWKDLKRVIWDFYSEKFIYDFNTGYCPPGKLCGHYTQLVWATTCSIGCAAAFCPYFYNGRGIRSGVMVACNYGPAGNYIGRQPYVYGKPCQMCPNSCKNDLCPSQCERQPNTPSPPRISNIPENYLDLYNDRRRSTATQRKTSITTTTLATIKVNISTTTKAKSLTTTAPPREKSKLETENTLIVKDKTCVNRHPGCRMFKKLNYCYLQRPYMIRYCRLECDISCYYK